MSNIYYLNWDFSHLVDNFMDAYHIPFKNSNLASLIFLDIKYKDKLPDKLLFKANFNIIPKIDYPITDLNIPILSKKMVSILNSFNKLNAIFTETIMIDDTFIEDIFDENGIIKSEINTNLDYQAITLIEREDCFDYTNSIYQPSEINPNIPGYIEKLVLKNNSSLPSIFRIKESPSKLFINEFAKNEFIRNGIKGCLYEEVETS